MGAKTPNEGMQKDIQDGRLRKPNPGCAWARGEGAEQHRAEQRPATALSNAGHDVPN